jgi:hypothetical protein
MAVDTIYWWFRSGFYAYGSSQSWSFEVNIPEQTVYASAALSSIAVDNGTIFCGVMLYYVKEGIFTYPRFPSPQSHGVTPGIFDSNVVSVVFGYGIDSDNAEADCHFAIMGFGP